MASTPVSNGKRDMSQMIFQAALAVPCKSCKTTHRMLLESDDQEFLENTADFLLHQMVMRGHEPIAASIISFHPATDLSARDWQSTDALLDNAAILKEQARPDQGMPF